MNGTSSSSGANTSTSTSAPLPVLPMFRYRVGDYASFRTALLTPLPGETELVDWRPTAEGDLAVQLVEWWAYLADVLTFYNEQIANQSYLETTSQPTNLLLLTNLIGYSPAPPTVAVGQVAAVLSSPAPVTIPSGFALQSKAGPGQTPQIFETETDAPFDAASTTSSSSAIVVDTTLPTPIDDRSDLLFDGPVTGVSPGDVVVVTGTSGIVDSSARRKAVTAFLLDEKTALPPPAAQALRVASVAAEKDPLGRGRYRVSFPSASTLSGYVGDFSLLRTSQFAVPSSVHTDGKSLTQRLGKNVLVVPLAAPLRTLSVGDLTVVEDTDGGITPMTVVFYEERWFPPPPTPPRDLEGRNALLEEQMAAQAPPPPSVLYALVHLAGAPAASAPAPDPAGTPATPAPTVAKVWHGFRSVSARPTGESPVALAAGAITVKPLASLAIAPSYVLLEDANQQGAPVTVTSTTLNDDKTVATISLTLPPNLTAPISLLPNVVTVSQGRTVTNEVLGSGDASAVGQTFALQKGPLVYLPPNGTSRLKVTSTLSVSVNGLPWFEVDNFYGAGPTATVYVVSHDANQGTAVVFGDGVRGARLPTGRGNVTATYRYGSVGTAIDPVSPPPPTKLTTMLTPQPGVTRIRNPVGIQPGTPGPGGPAIVKQAPATVQTLARAITAADYESIALNAGAGWARATLRWSRHRRRTVPVVYIDQKVPTATVLDAFTTPAPHSGVEVHVGRRIDVRIDIRLFVFPGHHPGRVGKEVKDALFAAGGPLAPLHPNLNRPPNAARIRAACHDVGGVVSASVEVKDGPFAREPDAYFVVSESDVHVHSEVDRNG